MTALAPALRPRQSRRMGSVKIPFVTFKGLAGRPAFFPSPAQRALGFKFRYLEHAEGRPFSLDECLAWSRAFERDLAEARRVAAGDVSSARAPRTKVGAVERLGGLLARWTREAPAMQGKAVVSGRKRRAPLAPATVRFYKGAVRGVERCISAPVGWETPLPRVNGRGLDGLVDAIEQAQGLHAARAARAMLKVAFKWAFAEGLLAHDAAAHMAASLPMPAGRIRAATVSEIAALVAAAESPAGNRPELADMVLFAALTGQRQTDRLTAHRRDCRDDNGRASDEIWLNPQSKKKGQPLAIVLCPMLQARFAAARARRAAHRVQHGELVIDEKTQAPWRPDWFRHEWSRIRALAAAAVPSVATLHEQDLRDTFAHWAGLAGQGELDIMNVLGHSLKAASTLKRHYAANSPAAAARTIAAVAAWYEAEAGKAGGQASMTSA